jgi:hypothetical protein
VLENFFAQGLTTGGFVSQIVYQLSEGYVSGQIFENLKSDVDASYQKMGNNFEQLLNPQLPSREKNKAYKLSRKTRLQELLEKSG